MQESQLQRAHSTTFVKDVKDSGSGEVAQVGSFHLAAAAKLQKIRQIFGRHHHAHALLGLAEQDFPRGEARVLERRAFKMKFSPA